MDELHQLTFLDKDPSNQSKSALSYEINKKAFREAIQSGNDAWCEGAFSDLYLDDDHPEMVCFAAKYGRLTAVKILIEKGASASKPDHSGMTPLFHAVSENHLGVAEYLLQQQVSTAPANGFSCLRLAVERNNTEAIKLLVANGHDVNECFGDTPLHVASRLGHSEAARLLLNHGADTNARVLMFGYTPLHVAVSKVNNQTIIDLLVEGTDRQAVTSQGQSPVEIAAVNNNVYAIHCLAEHGWDINHVSHAGSFPLLKAVETRSLEALDALLERGCKIQEMATLRSSSSVKQAISILHTASSTDLALPVISRLLSRNVNVNIHASVSMETPLHIAARSGAVSLVKLYLKYGAKCKALDVKGFTPFSCAILAEQTKVCQIFVKIGEVMQKTLIGMPNLSTSELWRELMIGNNVICSLASLCREVIRDCLVLPFIQSIKSLPIPTALQQFLSMDVDLDNM